MAPLNQSLRVEFFDPPQEVSGMTTVVLDSNGRLIGFMAVPPQVEQAPAAETIPDWSAMLAETGLDPASLKPAEPTWLPPVGFDRRFGWHGAYPEDPGTELQISAASYHGKPVYFHVIGPWSRPWRMQEQQWPRSRAVHDATLVIGGFASFLAAALFARRNLRLGRGDRRGAFRISVFVFSADALAGLLVAHHVPELSAEWQVFVLIVGGALFTAAFLWLCYMALEPFVRKQWPQLLISWTRLLTGKFHDPLIGRDLLAGILLGSISALGVHFSNSLPAWFNLAGETTVPANPLALGAPSGALGMVIGFVVVALLPAFWVTFLLFVTRLVLKGYWASVIVTGVVLLLINLGAENFLLETPFAILTTAITMFAVLRFGIFAMAVTVFTANLLTSFPITVDFSRWYAPNSIFMFAVLLTLLIYGLRMSLGNRPLLQE